MHWQQAVVRSTDYCMMYFRLHATAPLSPTFFKAQNLWVHYKISTVPIPIGITSLCMLDQLQNQIATSLVNFQQAIKCEYSKQSESDQSNILEELKNILEHE
jgi:hypothetical protein